MISPGCIDNEELFEQLMLSSQCGSEISTNGAKQPKVYSKFAAAQGNQAHAEYHEHHHYPETNFKASSYFPMPVEGAIKRNRLQEEIQAKLNNQKTPIKELAIVGVTGSGKTEAAKEYAENYEQAMTLVLEEKPFIYFIDARFRNYLTSLESLARSLGINLKLFKKDFNQPSKADDDSEWQCEDYKRELSKHIQQELHRYPQWLLVFDNVESLSHIQSFVPHTSGLTGIILYTSQDTHLFTRQKRVNTNDGLFEEEAIELFENLTLIKDRSTALKLANALDKLPLAIQVAGRYIAHQREESREPGHDYGSYLDLHQTQLEALDDEQREICANQGISHTQYAMIKLTIDKLSAPGKALLDFCSLFGNRELPEEFLRAFTTIFLGQSDTIGIESDACFKALRKYGLLNLDNPTIKTWSFHQVTHNYAWFAYKHQFDASELNLIIHSVQEILSYPTFNVQLNENDYERIKEVYPHIIIFFSKLKKEKKINPIDEELFKQSTNALDSIENWMFHVCAREVMWNEHALFESAQSLFDSRFNELSLEKGILLKQFGITTFFEDSDSETAIDMLESSLKAYELFYGENHVELISVLSHLSICYNKLENIEKAQEYVERAIHIHNLNTPNNDVSLPWMLFHLTNLYLKMQKFKEAATTLEKALASEEDMRENRYPDNFQEEPSQLEKLNQAYLDHGNHYKYLDFGMFYLSPNQHPHRISGNLHMDSDTLDKTIIKINQTIFIQSYHRNHAIEFLDVLGILIRKNFQTGNTEAVTSALENFTIILDKVISLDKISYNEKIPPCYPFTSPYLYDLGYLYHCLGDIEKAIVFLDRALLIIESEYCDISLLRRIGFLAFHLGNTDKALTILNQILNILDPSDWHELDLPGSPLLYYHLRGTEQEPILLETVRRFEELVSNRMKDT